MKQTLLLFFLLLSGQACSGMNAVNVAREVINYMDSLETILEPNRLIRGCNVGLSLTLLLIACKYIKKVAPNALFKPIIALPTVNMQFKDLLKLHAQAPHLITGLLIVFMKYQQIDIASDVLIGNISSIIVGMSNSIMVDYHDYCHELRKKNSLTLESKITFDPELIAEQKCAICWGELEDPINPCQNKDHLFCTACLTDWFKAKNENTEDTNKHVFKCDLCKQKIAIDSPKIIISRIEHTLNNKEFIKTLAGTKGILLVFLACNLCCLVFLLTA